MKKLHDFVFCDGVLTRFTVFYLVKVGTSQKDKAAAAYIRARAQLSNDFLFSEHSFNSSEFLSRCAASIFGVPSDGPAVGLLRRAVVDVSWLARFLKSYPPQLLNSECIPVPAARVR